MVARTCVWLNKSRRARLPSSPHRRMPAVLWCSSSSRHLIICRVSRKLEFRCLRKPRSDFVAFDARYLWCGWRLYRMSDGWWIGVNRWCWFCWKMKVRFVFNGKLYFWWMDWIIIIDRTLVLYISLQLKVFDPIGSFYQSRLKISS